jgi:hypothetical protein
MSFVSPDPAPTVAGIAVSAPISGAPVVGGVHTGDILPFTGAGPGTFYLAIIGFVTLIAGLFATVLGRRKPIAATAKASVNGLADLSPLAGQLDD